MPEPKTLTASETRESTLAQLAGWGQRRSLVQGLLLVGLTLGIFYLLFRRIDLLMLAGFALVGGLAFRDLTISVVAGSVILGVLSVVVLTRLPLSLPFGSRLQAKVDDLLLSLRVLGRNPRILTQVLLITAANWGASIVQTKLLFDGVGANTSLAFTAAALPRGNLRGPIAREPGRDGHPRHGLCGPVE